MKQEKETIKRIIASMRRNRITTNEYFNPSMSEKKPVEESIDYEEVTYVVEWQMRHPMESDTPEFKLASG